MAPAPVSRSEKIPSHAADFADPATPVRKTSMQQTDAESFDVGERVSGLVEESSMPVSNPRQSDFAYNTLANSQQQHNTRPRSRARDNSQAEPVSVLRKRDEEVRLAPDDLYENSVELAEPADLEPGDFGDEEFYESSTDNVLRNRKTRWNRNSIQEESTDDDEFQLESPFDDEESDEESQNPLERSCDYFRKQLLNQPITEIALDMSPPGKPDLFGENEFRVWRDAEGNELTQGKISDLRRGYVVVDTGNGEVRLPYARLSDTDWAAISEYWYLPTECGLGSSEYMGRTWIPQTVTWHASALCHKPLYFENIQLERYGHSHGPFLQPVVSTGHFFVRLFFLPYNSAINPPNECQYALGFYRPGNCAPWLRDPVPISLRGAVSAGLFYTAIGTITR